MDKMGLIATKGMGTMAIVFNVEIVTHLMFFLFFRNSFVRGAPHAVSQICIAELSTGKETLF